jgi:CHAD domain-containing protein
MAFVLKPHKPVARQLRRLVAEELHDALAALSDPESVETGVHDARKSVKKVRAVVRVLHDDLGSRDRDNERLRQIAHRLSSLRDADATGETLQQLRGRYPRVITAKMVRDIARGLEGS